jgi:nucleotide-binding universal stress UspA family protein
MANTRERKTVVVGVGGPQRSSSAIRLAAQEARYRDADLLAVMAYSTERALGAPAARPLATMRTAEDEHLAAESALRDAVVDALGIQAERVQLRTMPGLPGRKLVEAAQNVNAELIVLAARGSTSLLPGTVSQYVMRKASCPVLIIPAISAKDEISAQGNQVSALPDG